jgi:cell division protein FtsB
MWHELDHNGQQEVAEGYLIPILTKAVQELSTQVDELKAEITTLKGE